MATSTMKIKLKGNPKIREKLLPYLYLFPAFLVMGFITFYPLIYQVILSFTNFETRHLFLGLKSPDLENIGLQNYIDIVTGGLPVQNFGFFRVLVYNIWCEKETGRGCNRKESRVSWPGDPRDRPQPDGT